MIMININKIFPYSLSHSIPLSLAQKEKVKKLCVSRYMWSIMPDTVSSCCTYIIGNNNDISVVLQSVNNKLH